MNCRGNRLAAHELQDGDLLDLQWVGHVANWHMLGVSTKLKTWPVNKNGMTKTNAFLTFHVSRKWGYYFCE
jgi:hypothetical protein